MILNSAFSTKRVEMSLSALESRKVVTGIHNSYSGSQYEVSRSGYLEVEKALKQPDGFYAHFQIGGEQWLTSATREGVPASDRIVSLQHNEPDYDEIAAGLEAVREQLRTENQLLVDGEERERLLSSLAVASETWRATQLRIVQIKVGVLLAVEDAAQALESIGKQIAAALLIDTIKAFVKNHFGVDLDKI